jgi:hypothetical protein
VKIKLGCASAQGLQEVQHYDIHTRLHCGYMEAGFRFRPLYRPLELMNKGLFGPQHLSGCVDKRDYPGPRPTVLPCLHRIKSLHYVYINIGNVYDLRGMHVAYMLRSRKT